MTKKQSAAIHMGEQLKKSQMLIEFSMTGKQVGLFSGQIYLEGLKKILLALEFCDADLRRKGLTHTGTTVVPTN